MTNQRESATVGAVAQGVKQRKHGHSRPLGANWPQYEFLKACYTAQAATSGEYEAACRRAAREAGV